MTDRDVKPPRLAEAFGIKPHELAYLASPYSHPNPGVRAERFRAACEWAARLMKEGILVFSPIAHSHSIAEYGGLPGDFEFWGEWSLEILGRCDLMLVLELPGWEESVGLRTEEECAAEEGIRVFRISECWELSPERVQLQKEGTNPS